MKRLAQAILFSLVCLGLMTVSEGHQGKTAGDRIFSEARMDRGETLKRRLLAWDSLVRECCRATDMQKLERVNAFFNGLTRDDYRHGKNHRATPLEVLAANGGDSEDLTFAKYFTLRALGFSADRLDITYVSTQRKESGLVLTYRPDSHGDPLVMDTRDDSILPGSERTDLTAVSTFRGIDLWQAKIRQSGQAAAAEPNPELWTSLDLPRIDSHSMAFLLGSENHIDS